MEHVISLGAADPLLRKVAEATFGSLSLALHLFLLLMTRPTTPSRQEGPTDAPPRLPEGWSVQNVTGNQSVGLL